MQRRTSLIRAEKLQSLLKEGFELEYLENIMTPRYSKENPAIDLNEDVRVTLGLYGHNLMPKNTASMTNSRLSATASPLLLNRQRLG